MVPWSLKRGVGAAVELGGMVEAADVGVGRTGMW